MSGIAGIVHASGRAVSPEELERVADAAAIRGADGVTLWRDGPAGLIRFHHATTPEAVGEQQPCAGPSGAVIAFDGRLDNRSELLALLGRRGAALSARPDVEIAMALFEAFGDGFLRRLTGDYALAIWQPEQRRLFCARSPVGWRPFHYTVQGERFAFASDMRALVVGLGLERRLNEAMIAELLTQRVVSHDETFWDGLLRLPQGSALEFCGGAVRRWHWDDVPYENLSGLSERDHVERFNELFDQALIACTRSNTGVVSQLSGGVDSSSIFSRAIALQRAGRIDQPVAAISARFPGSPVDETVWSSAVERHLGIEARVVSGGSFDLAAAQAWSAQTLLLPLRPNTIDTQQNLFRNLERHGERVLLSGEGGDELLGGNHAHWPDALRRGRIDRIAREALAIPGLTAVQRLRSVVAQSLGPLLSTARYRQVGRREHWVGQPYPDFINADWIARTGLNARTAASRPLIRLDDIAAQNRYAMIEYPLRDLSFGVSQAFAASRGVEYRHPLYDLRLLRFYLGAAGGVLFRGDERKHLLREAMRGTLVETVRTRPGKTHFNPLIMDGLAAFYAARPLAQQWPVKLGWVDADKVTVIWNAFDRWDKDGAAGPPPRLPFGALWNVAALDIWLEHAFGL